MVRTLVLYDEDCGFCRWSADRLRAWDHGGALAFAPIQGPEGDRWLGTMDPETRLGMWHVVAPDERVWSGGAAVPELLRRLPLGSAPAAVAEAAPGITDRLYRSIARHRAALGALLGQAACSVDPRGVGR